MISYFQWDIIEISYSLRFCLIMKYTHILFSLHWAPTSHWCQTWPQVPVISWGLLGTNGKVWIQWPAHPISATKSQPENSTWSKPAPLSTRLFPNVSHAPSKPTHHLCWALPAVKAVNTCLCSRTQHLLRPRGARCCHQQGRPKLGSDVAGFVLAAKANDSNEEKSRVWPKQNSSLHVSSKIRYPALSVVIQMAHFNHKVLLQYKWGEDY